MRWIARELEELKLFDGVNLYLSKLDQADTKSVRRMLDQQYAKLRRLGAELRRAVN